MVQTATHHAVGRTADVRFRAFLLGPRERVCERLFLHFLESLTLNIRRRDVCRIWVETMLGASCTENGPDETIPSRARACTGSQTDMTAFLRASEGVTRCWAADRPVAQ